MNKYYLKKIGLLLIGCFLSMPLMSHAINEPTIMDLTHPLNSHTICWPTEKGFDLKKIFYGITSNGFFYSAFKLSLPEHCGTHVDAPRHFIRDGKTIDQIPPQQLVGNAVVIDVSAKVKNNPDYAITSQDIQDFEKQYRPINHQDIVLFYTGWSRYWNNKKQYLGSDKFGDVKHLHFPGLSEEAAYYLTTHKIKGVGLDTASMDPGVSQTFRAHQIILGANLFGIENLLDFHRLPAIGAQLIVAPMNIEGGSGGPARVFAFIQKQVTPIKTSP